MKTTMMLCVAMFAASTASAGEPTYVDGYVGLTPDAAQALCQKLNAAKVQVVQKKVAVKKKAVAKLEAKAKDAKGDLAKELKELAKKESEDIKVLQAQLDELKEKLDKTATAGQVSDLSQKVDELVKIVSDLSARVSIVERALHPIQIGPRLGAAAWFTADGKTRYTGGLVGARLTLRTASVDVYGEVDLGLAVQKAPVSLISHVGIGIPLHEQLTLNVGIIDAEQSINNDRLSRKSLIGLEAGASWQPGWIKGLSLNATLVGGAMFAKGRQPAATFGGTLGVGMDF